MKSTYSSPKLDLPSNSSEPGRSRQPRRTPWWGAALGVATAVLLAMAVYGGGVTPNATQPPLATDHLPPSNCGSCHGDFAATNHEPFPTWAGSMMANSARDPLFWAALDVANNDVPGVGDFCLRCHMPTGWLAGRSEPPGGTTDGCSMLGDLDGPDSDFSGVSCHHCHRMMENPSPPMGELPVYTENAEYWIDDADCTTMGSGPCRRGPYDYPMGGDSPPPHQWAFSPYHESSSICGNCHNVTSPINTLIDEAGTDTGVPYPVERTYTEWTQSDYAIEAGADFATCQNCHMPDASEDPVYACFFEETNRTDNLPIHQFVGGNTWVPAVLRDEYPALNRADSFNATIAWAEDLLKTQSATIGVTAPSKVPAGGTLDAQVRITNLSGHKLPTGYTEGRRMWINVQARDGADNLIWESGAYDAATGELTEDAQIKIYARESGTWNGLTNECEVTNAQGDHVFHFVLNDCILEDNRIPPKGFTGAADIETRPVGYTYPETSVGSGVLVNFDDTSYAIPIPSGTPSPVTVEARLYYQTASKEYVEFLLNEAIVNGFPDDCISRTGASPMMSRGEILFDLWTRYDRSPPTEMVLASSEIIVDLDIFADGFESGNTSAWTLTFP